MLILRILGMLAFITIGAGLVAFLVTQDKRYLRFSWQVAKYGLMFAFLLVSLLAFERVLVMAL